MSVTVVKNIYLTHLWQNTGKPVDSKNVNTGMTIFVHMNFEFTTG